MHTKFILVNCEQATVALTGDLKKMGKGHDATHKVLLVKCEEVPGDLKNNMGKCLHVAFRIYYDVKTCLRFFMCNVRSL
jgi:hypothetical protein